MKRKLTNILSVLLIIAFAITSLALVTIPVSSINLNTSNINLLVGETYKLKISVTPENATDKRISYSSANKNIATVDGNGKIKGIKLGKTIITVISKSNKKALAKCNVIVVPKLAPMKITVCGNTLGQYKPQKEGFVVKYVENKFNVDLSFFDVSSINQSQQFNIKLASGEIPDVFWGYKLNDWYSMGVIRPISVDLIKENLAIVWPQVKQYDIDGFALQARKRDGKLYGVPMLGSAWACFNYTRLYRLDWLENLGLSVPKTLDEMEIVLNAFSNKDPDGNGIKDTYGINELPNEKQDFSDVFGAFGVLVDSWQVKEGKIVYSSTTNEYKTALKLLAKWYNLGYINPEFMTDSLDTFKAKFVESKFGSFHSYARWNTDIMQDTPVYLLKKKNPKAKIVYADAVKGPSGKSGTFGPGGDGGGSLVFGKDVKDEKVARYLQIVDYMMGTNDGLALIIGGSAYEKIDGKVITRVDPWEGIKQGMGESFIYPIQPEVYLTLLYGNKGTPLRNAIQQFMNQPMLTSAIGKMPLTKAKEKGIGNDIPKICNQFFYDGITGKINIDKEWDRYLKDLDQAGLKDWTTEAAEIYRTKE